ncbi:hypothetical protein CPC08DRAFT_418749 [Agrocybe pediades]|nr:hypothetical protein CPC08DRAFT_418749 [Agrocybe pediades]
MKYRIPDIGTDEYEPVKNITYFLSKHPLICSAQRRGLLHLGTSFVSKYAHIVKALIDEMVGDPCGRRESPDGCLHSLYRDGND